MRVAMRSSALKLAAPVFVVGLAACGSSNNTTTNAPAGASSTPTATAVVAHSMADVICFKYNAQINAVRPTPASDPASADAASLPAIAAWLDVVIPLARQEQQELSLAPDAGSLNGPFADVFGTVAQADTAAKGTDPMIFQTDWNNFIGAQKTFHDAATAGHFPNCAK